MRPVPAKRRDKVLQGWLNGKDYRAIEGSTGISLGKISNIISGNRKEMPDLDDLRDLNLELAKQKKSVKAVAEGIQILSKLEEMGIAASDLPQVMKLLRELGENAMEILLKATELRSLEQNSGISYSQALENYEAKKQKTMHLREDVSNLRKVRDDLVESLDGLRILQSLQDKLAERGITPKKLDRFMDLQEQLETRGFNPETANALSNELLQHGLTPSIASRELAEALIGYRNLKEVDKKLQKSKYEVQMNEITIKRQDERIIATEKLAGEVSRQMEAKHARIKSEAEATLEMLVLDHKRRMTAWETEEEAAKRSANLHKKRNEKLNKRMDALARGLMLTTNVTREEIGAARREANSLEPLKSLSVLLAGRLTSLSKENMETLAILLGNLEPALKKSSIGKRGDYNTTSEQVKSLRLKFFEESRNER